MRRNYGYLGRLNRFASAERYFLWKISQKALPRRQRFLYMRQNRKGGTARC
nr:MAG TPA: hypothetical protein [Caudoviricetes sp.]